MITHATRKHVVNQYVEEVSIKMFCCQQVSGKRICLLWKSGAVGGMKP